MCIKKTDFAISFWQSTENYKQPNKLFFSLLFSLVIFTFPLYKEQVSRYAFLNSFITALSNGCNLWLVCKEMLSISVLLEWVKGYYILLFMAWMAIYYAEQWNFWSCMNFARKNAIYFIKLSIVIQLLDWTKTLPLEASCLRLSWSQAWGKTIKCRINWSPAAFMHNRITKISLSLSPKINLLTVPSL